MTDHARQLAATLGLRMPTTADLPVMIEAATLRGGLIVGSPSPPRSLRHFVRPVSSCPLRP